jgi:hypothetical protein
MNSKRKPKFYKVLNETDPAFQKVAILGKDIFLTREALGLSLSDVVVMMTELNGDALVGAKRDNGLSGIYVSSNMVCKGLKKKKDPMLGQFIETLEIIRKNIDEATKEIN